MDNPSSIVMWSCKNTFKTSRAAKIWFKYDIFETGIPSKVTKNLEK